MKHLRDVTLGQIGDTLIKYRPFLATVVAVLLIVLLLPGRSGNSTVASGTGGLTTVNPGQSTSEGAGGSSVASSASSGPASVGTNPAAAVSAGSGGTVGAPTGPGGGSGVPTAAPVGGGGRTGPTAPPVVHSHAPEVVPAGRYGAASVGTAAALDSPNCNHSLGQVKMPTIYAPPCVAPFPKGASNGGATAQGVSGSTIKIGLYLPANGAQTAALDGVGLTEPGSDQVAQIEGAAQLFEHHVEIYGRKVDIVPFTSSVTSEDAATAEEEANADAIQVATQNKPFLSLAIGATSANYDEDVAQRGVVAFSEYNWDDTTYQKLAPYLYGLYDNQHIFTALAAYLGKEIWGHDAQYAGSPLYTHQARKIGVIYSTADFSPTDIAQFNADAAQYGVKFTDEVGIDDSEPTTAAQQAQTAVIQMEAGGVTTVVPLLTLFGLVAVGPSATKQGWFPEWIVNPFGFADADQVAQLMDQTQWKHAFGMTGISPPINPVTDDQNGVGLWEWQYHSPPPGTDTYAGLALEFMSQIFTGLELAGPDLTPSTFRAGLFDAAPRGGAFIGGAATTALAFGNHGVWPTPDYSSSNDYTQEYWSATTSCTSQDGQTQHGCYLWTNGAKRYLWTQWPSGEPNLFSYASTDITNFSGGDPPNERAPSYPEVNYY